MSHLRVGQQAGCKRPTSFAVSLSTAQRVSPGESIGCEYRFLAKVFDVRIAIDDRPIPVREPDGLHSPCVLTAGRDCADVVPWS
jgi:hypothetical protein